MDHTTRKKYRARLIFRQPVYDENRCLVDYQWDSCEVEFASRLDHPVVSGAEIINVLEEVRKSHQPGNIIKNENFSVENDM